MYLGTCFELKETEGNQCGYPGEGINGKVLYTSSLVGGSIIKIFLIHDDRMDTANKLKILTKIEVRK